MIAKGSGTLIGTSNKERPKTWDICNWLLIFPILKGSKNALGSYFTCLRCAFSLGTFVWKVSQILSAVVPHFVVKAMMTCMSWGKYVNHIAVRPTYIHDHLQFKLLRAGSCHTKKKTISIATMHKMCFLHVLEWKPAGNTLSGIKWICF